MLLFVVRRKYDKIRKFIWLILLILLGYYYVYAFFHIDIIKGDNAFLYVFFHPSLLYRWLRAVIKNETYYIYDNRIKSRTIFGISNMVYYNETAIIKKLSFVHILMLILLIHFIFLLMVEKMRIVY